MLAHLINSGCVRRNLDFKVLSIFNNMVTIATLEICNFGKRQGVYFIQV